MVRDLLPKDYKSFANLIFQPLIFYDLLSILQANSPAAGDQSPKPMHVQPLYSFYKYA